MDYWGIVSYGALFGVLLIAVFTDVRFQKIPNWLTFSAVAAALIMWGLRGGLEGILKSLGGIAVGIAVLLIPYLMGGMGAGDAKLMGAIGSFLGPSEVFSAFLFSALCGGVYALILLVIHGTFRSSLSRYREMARSFLLTRQFNYRAPGEAEATPRLRYGIAIASGTLLSIFWGHEALIADMVDKIT